MDWELDYEDEEDYAWYQDLLAMIFAPGYMLICSLVVAFEGFNYVSGHFAMLDPIKKPLSFCLSAIFIGFIQFFLMMSLDSKLSKYKANKKLSQGLSFEGKIIGFHFSDTINNF